MAHELIAAFEQQNLPLHRVLTDMLNEAPAHRTVRRGCGLTQATRFLSDYINRPREPLMVDDLSLFKQWPRRSTRALASQSLALGWKQGWRNINQAPEHVLESLASNEALPLLLVLPQQIEAIKQQLSHHESLCLLNMMEDLLFLRSHKLPELAPMAQQPEIGSCSMAEAFFLEIAHARIRRGGSVNIWVDEAQRPVLVEKMNLGESRSALFVSPASIGGVRIVPGALAALDYSEDLTPIKAHSRGNIYPLTGLKQIRFLRLTTLAVAPADRKRAFSVQFQHQITSNMLSPQSTTLADLLAFAEQCVEAL
mgnify:CR=1 FL=1